jgi:hypothetical protein
VELNEVRDSYEVAIAEYDFESDKEGDLPFKEGEEIVILSRVSPEWWKGRAGHKREGIFPSAYVRLTGEVDYATADEEAAKWSEIEEKARRNGFHLSSRREQAEIDLENERHKLEEASLQAANHRMQHEAEVLKQREAAHEAEMQKIKNEQIGIMHARAEAERRHEEARLRLQVAKMEEEAAEATLRAAEAKKEKTRKEKEADSELFADVGEDVGRKPIREVKKVNKFANLGGGNKCPRCDKTVGHAEKAKGPGNTVYHSNCLRCSTCDKVLTGGEFSEHDNHPYCRTCYGRGFGPKGFGYGGSVVGDDGGGIGRDRKHAVGVVDEASPMESLKKPVNT